MDRTRDNSYADFAERLVESLTEIDLGRWREAAMAALRAAEGVKSAQMSLRASPSVASVQVWRVLDMLETASHRLTGREAQALITSTAERRSIQMITHRAVVALLLPDRLKPDDMRAISDPFLALIR